MIKVFVNNKNYVDIAGVTLLGVNYVSCILLSQGLFACLRQHWTSIIYFSLNLNYSQFSAQ